MINPNNPLRNVIGFGQNPPNPMQNPVGQSGIQFQNPMQKMNYIMEAMRNPAAFVKRYFPDIPDSIANNGDQVLNYLKQTRGISDMDIQNAQSQIPQMPNMPYGPRY